MARSGHVSQINTPYSQQKQAQQAVNARYAARVHARRRRIIVAATLVLALIFGVQIISTRHSLAEVNGQISQTQQVLKRKRTTNRQLKSQVKALHNPDYLQQVLRSKYNYAKKGETLYNLGN
ncbi:FtsB family cell division protein [Limosilactobacillus difficilis]|uniref:FtsB family cell division protein n=1 Tax=Limosilactobacillus difficilis TaxID=2991838 RepID=UPI0024BB32A8|nr:septum formation initiator family protein [Limosilactobacillus difficilis]